MAPRMPVAAGARPGNQGRNGAVASGEVAATVPLLRAGVTRGQSDSPEEVATKGDRPTMSEGTRQAYRRRVIQLKKRFRKEVGKTDEATMPLVFVDWLIAQKPSIVAPTWRQYKASVCTDFQRTIAKASARLDSKVEPLVADQITVLITSARRALALLQVEGPKGCASKTTATSAIKAKSFSEEDRIKIYSHLAPIKSRYAADLNDYLLAGLRTGLRPIEWVDTTCIPDLQGGAFTLRVKNAKFDSIRGHGPFRTLIFADLPALERETILRWLNRVRKAGEGAPALVAALSDLLYMTTRRLWPQRKRYPTLSSVRHAFAALAKLAYEPAEVAALMGHASDLTATQHYGRHRGGRKPKPDVQALLARLPCPAPEEVARVRRRFAVERERLANFRAAAGIAPPASP